MTDYPNYDAHVPAGLRSEVSQRIARAQEERLIHSDDTSISFVLALVMLAYCYPRPAGTLPEKVMVLIPGLDQSPGATGMPFGRPWPATLVDVPYDPPVYQVAGDPNGVAVGRFKASLRKFLGL